MLFSVLCGRWNVKDKAHLDQGGPLNHTFIGRNLSSMTEAMQCLERISRWHIYSRYHTLSVKCAGVWKVWSFPKQTITYIFQQLPTSLNNYLRRPTIRYITQQLRTSSNNYLLHPRITYFTQQLPKSPKNYITLTKNYVVYLHLPTSPNNYQSPPAIAYVTRQLHKSPNNYLRRPKITLRHTQWTEYLYCLGFNFMTPLFFMNDVKVRTERVVLI